MASAFVKEASISQEDAQRLAQAAAAVNAFYANTISPKMVAWVNLASISAGIYGPRVLAYGLRKRLERQPKMVMSRPTMAGATPQNPPVKPETPAPRPPMSSSLKDAYSDPMLVSMPGDDES